MTKAPNLALRAWVNVVTEHTQPDAVHWWLGTAAEREQVGKAMARERRPELLEPDLDPSPVVIATPRRVDAGPTNSWMSCDDAHSRVWPWFRGAMRGRTLYVVPYLLAPPRSGFCRVGVELTDSPHVALAIDGSLPVGRRALDQLAGSPDFVRGLHSLGGSGSTRRMVVHFPESVETWSIGSGGRTSALLCSGREGLRLACSLAREEGWLAEHMTMLSLQHPDGATSYFAVAAAGSALSAELPSLISRNGWTLTTLPGDACWLRAGGDGRLWAINPEFRGPEPVLERPLSAIVFCGRHARSTPLVYESRSWRHGVYVGATLMAEAPGTSAATHDPMSMLATCPYNLGDYFGHWLAVGRKLHAPPKIYHVNWFRSDASGRRLWPGEADHVRLFRWIAERVEGTAGARESPLGVIPDLAWFDRDGLDISSDQLEQLLSCNHAALLRQAEGARKFLMKLGDTLPAPLLTEHRQLVRRLEESLH